MYRVVCTVEQKGGLKRDFEVGTYPDLTSAKTALTEWLKPYGLRCYQYEELFLSITGFYTCYIHGSETYYAIAFIHVEGDPDVTAH
jgi:hypothetical protein